jgi:hypothetical protein
LDSADDEDELKEALFVYFDWEGSPKDNSKSSARAPFSTCWGGGAWDSSVVLLLHLVLAFDDELSVVGTRILLVDSFIDLLISLECGGVERLKSRQV